jgi:hypothetical protein
VSLNKESISNMTKTQARAALRETTPMSFYRKGRAGLALFSLLLIKATQPAGAVNMAAAAGYTTGRQPVVNVGPKKKWYSAFYGQEESAAARIAKQGVLVTTAYTTGSGTATTAVALSQFAATGYGKFMLALVVITFLIKIILSYGEERLRAQSQASQLAMIQTQMEHQKQMMQMLLNSQRSPRTRRTVRRGAPVLAANIARPALMAA